MNLDFLNEYYITVVLGACLIVGYILKHWIKDVDNKYIPTIVTMLGAILGCLVLGKLSLENLVYGGFSGLASTGLHQLFRQYLEKEEGEKVDRK